MSTRLVLTCYQINFDIFDIIFLPLICLMSMRIFLKLVLIDEKRSKIRHCVLMANLKKLGT